MANLVGDVCLYDKKSRLKASTAKPDGSYPFFTSSQKVTGFTDTPIYQGNALVIGSGGSPNIHYSETNFSASTDCFILRSKNEGWFRTKFIYHYLFGNIHLLARGFKGVGIKHLSKAYLDSIVIPDFTIEIQDDYVSEFDFLRNILEKRGKTKDLIEEYRRSLFLELFGDPVLNTKNLPVASVESLATKKPNAIASGPFGSLLKRSHYTKKGEFKVYGQEQVINGVDYEKYRINRNKYEQLTSFQVSANDVLVSLMGTPGKVAVIPAVFEKGVINPRLMKISFNQKKIRPIYFSFLFEKSPFNEKVISVARGGVMKGLNVKLVKQLSIPVPSIEVQFEFERYLATLSKLENLINKSHDFLLEYSQAFTFKAFNTSQEAPVDEIVQIMSDDVLIETLLTNILTGDFSSEEIYNDSVNKLFTILDKTSKQNKLRNGITQYRLDRSIRLKIRRDNEATLS